MALRIIIITFVVLVIVVVERAPFGKYPNSPQFKTQKGWIHSL